MTIDQLIKALQEIINHGTNPLDKVYAYDPDIDDYVTITGLEYGGNNKQLILCTDTDEERDHHAVQTTYPKIQNFIYRRRGGGELRAAGYPILLWGDAGSLS